MCQRWDQTSVVDLFLCKIQSRTEEYIMCCCIEIKCCFRPR
eukprot:07680.XXX_341436_341558_1 [CDS] Oithona nana genome sequencing.